MKVQQAHNQTQNMNIMEKENIICGVSYRYKKNIIPAKLNRSKLQTENYF